MCRSIAFSRILIIICALVCSLGACAGEAAKVKTHRVAKQRQQSKAGVTSQVTKSDKPFVLSSDDKLCVDKANELAFILLKKQSAEEPFKSFTFSPLSVSYALAMASNGASGATLKEIEALTGPSTATNSFYSRYVAHFTPSVVMSNYLAMNKRFIINPDYIKAITGVYNAQVSNLDFGTSKATQQINDWIKQQSGGEFDNIVKETHPNEIIYLVNYLKFKALWENPFDKKFTFDREFTNDDGTTTIVPSMFRYFSELYYEDNTCQAVSMKYDNSEFRMLVVLPKNSKINKFLMSMSASEFSRIVSGLKAPGMVVDLRLPRFSTDCNLNLRDMLATLMPTAFNDNADFSRLSKVHSYINRFTQDTKITVNEYGTEASGVTVQSNMFKSINLPFNATHPFLYFIYDETTHAILQAGQFCGDGFKTTESRNSRNVTANDNYDASDDGIFNSCAQMPHFPGGDGALMRFINDNLKYPPEAFENRIEGKVIIQFVVTKTGKVGQVRVARAVNRYLDREAIRLCKMLPDFTPGRNALGEPVSVWYTLPVSFKLPNNN
ncbi:MAG: TonB family protein [Muribaculaceae bacterium]|nr:TonB family protein [Muribaculaceae bacterium]